MLTLEAAPVRDRRQPQPDNSRDSSQVDALYLRRLVAIRLEMTAMMRIPTLDWPSDLFADAHLEVSL